LTNQPSILAGRRRQTILLTGATGFLGSHLLEALLKAGYSVVILKRSTSDTWRIRHLLDKVKSYDIDIQPMELAFNDQRIGAIIHTACHYGRQGEPRHAVVETNLVFSLKLMDLAIAHNTDTFLNTDTLLHGYLNAYTLSKQQFVEWLRQSCAKIRVVNLKLEHIYGPRDDKTKFIHWIISQLQQQAPSIKLTPGQQLRDFIYIEDVVAAYLLTLRKTAQLPAFSEYDVGTGTLTSIRTLVETLKSLYERQHGPSPTQLDFGAIPYRKGEMMSVRVDNMALLALGWNVKSQLTDGLLKTLQSIP
jgi:nucleoside-diphosphate-sugar epimerase